MRILAVGLVNCAVLVENLVIPIQATKHNVQRQQPPLKARQLATGNTGLALGSRRRQKQTSSPNTALEVLGAAMLQLLLWSAAAV